MFSHAEMKRDNLETPGGWALFVGDKTVSLHLPIEEEGHGQWIEIPREDFDRLARWYVARKGAPAPVQS